MSEYSPQNESMDSPHPFAGRAWLRQGLIWALFMFILMTLIFPWLLKEPITTRSLLLGLFIWTLGGLAYGYSMKLFLDKSRKDPSQK